MQFIDLKAQYSALRERIDRRIEAVLEHGAFIMGPEVAELEGELASYCGVGHAVTCANGTDALVLALRALGIGPGDAVFTTPFTFFATVEAIMLAGALPVFADIDPRTFNLDPVALQEAVERTRDAGRVRPRAVMTVDLFGLPADYATIEQVCARHGLELIEDAAQAFGASVRGMKAGAFGRVATTSFFPAKPLGCYGDGGALFTEDDELADVLRSLRMHGKGEDKYDNVRVGTNSRLDTIQAAILLEKLDAFPGELERRQQVAERYRQALPNWLTAPHVPDGHVSSWAQHSVLAASGDDRERWIAGLKSAGVPTAIYYARSLHLQTALAHLNHSAGDFPVAEDVSNRIFSLPMSAYLTEADQDRVIDALRALG
ncbi:DegT/DnrJ/EryC1/StrS family aminotransferase [Sphingomonas sp. SM33]|uniref:DegT/DnrJ/EryC1/StrS family aminotransferase n=1 Tax=Sphingomonas telluris TaxID=2907998 RepID=A0ABS9VLM6_9SPHN|nr:DegT/DnrJ/EryC1/StrS family aminotransferase [Sphingomonas telluris]MCH8615869.1 DegT/DnrJ/EryC1/StrS family aminotransferase [Sphingomonas telluris]